MINRNVNQNTKTASAFQKDSKPPVPRPPCLCGLSLPLKDLWQYFLNLTEANEKQRADWRLEYIMTEAFGLSDLRPARLLQLGLSFLLPPADAFRRYFAHFMVSYDSGAACEGECKLLQVCAVMHLDRRAYSRCVAGG